MVKQKNNFFKGLYLSLLVFLLLTGCEEKILELWVVESDTQLFASPDGDELKQIDIIKKGSVCTLGKVKTEKVYQYHEVLCEDGKYGWIVDAYHFKLIGKEKNGRYPLMDK